MFSDPALNIAKLGLADGMKVVDIGAGSGFYSLEAARRVGHAGRVYAVDVQKELLERLRSVAAAQGIRNIEAVWGDAEKIGGTKLREAVADRVIVSNILFQAKKRDDLVLEVKRLLKPGGRVLVIDWSQSSPMGPAKPVSAEETQTLFEKDGFRLDQAFGAGEHHYGFVFIRP